MDVERHLISAVVADRDLTPVADAGVTAKFFIDDKNRRVYETIAEHNRQYGEVPSLSALKMDFPDYRFVKPDDSLEFLVTKVRRSYQLALLQAGLEASVEAYDEGDPDRTTQILADVLSRIGNELPTTRDINLTTNTEERLENYYALRDSDNSLLGIPTGFASIDRATQGLQDEQLVTFVGPPKAGKSTVMLLVALAAWLAGKRVLFFTFEMSNDEMAQRVDAFRSGISAQRLRTGALKREEWTRLERALHAMESLPDFWLSADSSNATTLSGIAGKIDRYEPDVVFVDGVYLLVDEITGESGTREALTNLTRGFKRLAQNKILPVCISSQVLEWKMDKKKGITANSIGYSSSFQQDSDTIIGVERTDDEMINKLKVVLARNCPPMERFVQWDWEHGRFEELTADPFEGGEEGGTSF